RPIGGELLFGEFEEIGAAPARIRDQSEVHEFSDNSFGRTVLERVVPSSVNGKAELHLIPGRIEYRLTIPETEFEIFKRV
ncbi:sensor histidine kinase, partial [Rhizobium ruizarguesonis]